MAGGNEWVMTYEPQAHWEQLLCREAMRANRNGDHRNISAF